MPLASLSRRGSHQISSIQILNFPFVLIISLDTKPQEPEAGCQYSAFLSLFASSKCTLKSQFYHNGPTHDSTLKPAICLMNSVHNTLLYSNATVYYTSITHAYSSPGKINLQLPFHLYYKGSYWFLKDLQQ